MPSGMRRHVPAPRRSMNMCKRLQNGARNLLMVSIFRRRSRKVDENIRDS